MVKQSFRFPSMLRKTSPPIFDNREGDGEALKKKKREFKGPFFQYSSACLLVCSLQVLFWGTMLLFLGGDLIWNRQRRAWKGEMVQLYRQEGGKNSVILSDMEISKPLFQIEGLRGREESISTDLNTFNKRPRLGNKKQERERGKERGEEALPAVEIPEGYVFVERKEGEGEKRREGEREIGEDKRLTETDVAGGENVEKQGGERGEVGHFGKEEAESFKSKLALKTGSESEHELESGSGLGSSVGSESEIGSGLGSGLVPGMVSKRTVVEGSNEITSVQNQFRMPKDKQGLRNVGERGIEAKKEGDERLDLRQEGEREGEKFGSEIPGHEGKLDVESGDTKGEREEERREEMSVESQRMKEIVRGGRETRQGKAPGDMESNEAEKNNSEGEQSEREEREVKSKDPQSDIFKMFDFGEVASEPFAIRQRLEEDMFRKKMEKVLLHHIYHLDGATRAADCEEKKSDSEKEKQFCPSFGKCDASKSYMVSKCSNPSLVDNWSHGKPPLNFNQSRKANFTTMAPFQSNLFVLENMYINPKGHVFNSTHNFIFGGCSSLVDMDFVFPAETTFVTKFDVLTTLQTWSGVNFFHTMTETLPDFLALEKLLQKYPTIPVAVKNTQLWGPLPRVLPLLAPSLSSFSSLNLHVVPEKGLFFARRLVVPGHQFCGKPGGSVVRTLRDRFHVGTLGDGGSLLERTKQTNLSDWTIVVGRRDPGQQRALLRQDELMSQLEDRYGRNRVTSFWGNISIVETQQLFRRTILYMGPHGAGMTNLLFMPSKSAVLEIRPNRLVNPCYQYMSDRCNIDFYLLLGEGNFTSSINANISEILTLTDEILPWNEVKASTILTH